MIDAGNANFRDTMRRFDALKDSGLTVIGMGVSGGEEGARHGPSIMVGGTEASWKRVEKVLTSISAKYNDDPCVAWLGENGAGHFVKTIHNGIEYADMQMIAEVYGVMRDGLGMAPAEMAEVFARWNDGPLKSYLIEISARVLEATDPATGKPLVDVILDSAGQKGTGRWSAIEAQDLGVPATVIEAAVAARVLSSRKAEREAGQALFGAPERRFGDTLGDRAETLRILESALLAGKIVAYAQGFDVMAKASETWNWDLPLGTIAKIWRAGCIIRSAFLDSIASAYAAKGTISNLMMVEPFSDMLKSSNGSLRRVVASGALKGVAMPALASALAYFDMARTGRSTADLTQAQRDFFGAHGFERIGAPGIVAHGPWSNA
jgi:6-phosphogluconate dehydrogenase